MIKGMFDNGALPVLERVTQFTQLRHEMITGNIANLDTPYYKPRDISPARFQEALGKAIERRRERPNPVAGRLPMRDTHELRFDPGRTRPNAGASNRGILFHDQNNRDLERIMQDLAENTLAHNAAVEMVRNQFQMLDLAIRERP